MRLLLVIPKLVSYRAFLRELCLSLVADGVEVHLACSSEKLWGAGIPLSEDGVEMHAIEFPRGMDPKTHLRAARALNEIVEQIRPDIVHAHFSAAIFTTALARTSRWPKTFATFHGVSFLAMRGWKAAVLRRAETWAAGRFTAVWVLTDDDERGLRETARRAVVHRLPGYGVGCDIGRFTPPALKARAALRAKLGIAPDEIVFAFLGRYAEFKGFALVARAFLRLAARHENVRLLSIGIRDRLHATGLTDEEERALSESPRVIDAGYRQDVENCLGAADVMVFPSRREGMAVCLMEALALGIPAITTDTRGCREVVRDRVDGLVLRDPSVEELEAAMRLAAEDTQLRQQWSARARADRDRFDRAHFVAAQKEIYGAALPPPRERARLYGGRMSSLVSSILREAPARERVRAQPEPAAEMQFGAREFFLHFFSRLEERGIAYAILHGYSDFPDRFASDVDYAVRDRDLEKIGPLLANVAREHGWVVVQNVRHALFANYTVVVDPAKPANHLALDVCSHFARQGSLLVRDAVLLESRHRHARGFFVPAHASEFAHLLAKALTKRASLEKYLPRLTELAALDSAGTQRRFRELCGESGQALEHFLRYPETCTEKLGAKIRQRTAYGFPLRSAELVRQAQRALRPSGLRVSLLGPDGSGKSTLRENLQRDLAPFFQRQQVYKFRPDVFDQIGTESKVEAHARPPRGLLLSWAKTVFYFADWWLGFVVRLLPARRSGALVIFDRDFSDLLVDQRRHLIQGSGALASVLRRFLPKSDATFLLDADSALVHARKSELPTQELERQRAEFLALALSDRRIHVIHADCSAAEVAQKVAREILLLLAKREQRRHLPLAKRVFDLFLATTAIVVLAPLLLILALLVRVKLGTPILFRQTRPGLATLPFTICKFRTMVDTRDADGRLLPDPERVTRFGRFLRSTSLDELPELFNVLRGEMSLVGPRPLLVDYLPLYSVEQMRRHNVLPGITGWAQINGRNAASWTRKFELDVWYVDHRSLWLDLKIIALTFSKVIRREGIHQPGRFSSERFRGEQTERVTV